MNLTIPIRAQSSTSSWSRQLRGSSSNKYSKADRKRYIFSMITATLLVGSLIVGSIGGVIQSASARDNFSSRSYNYSPNTSQNRGSNTNNQTSNSSPSKTTTTTPATTKTTAPSITTKVTPTAQPAATTPAPAAQTATPVAVTPAKVVTPQIVAQPPAPAPVDTAPAIENMTAAQATKSTQPVSYNSNRISDDTRNRILMLAGVATVTGALLYTISFIGATVPASRREIPIRYIVPVREVVAS